jgi:precorrin-4 methylase
MHPSPDAPLPTIPSISDAPQSGGLVFLIGCSPERPTDLPWPARAALVAADVVLYEADVDAETLALIPSSCFVEEVQVGTPGSAARIEKLAAEGWRVVRLSLDSPAVWPIRLAEADRLAASGIAICPIASLPERPATMPDPSALWATPRPLSIGMNGLAG